MTLSIKDPGSAITHFIGMILAALASTPLLLLAAYHNGGHAVPALAVFAFSMILLYGASTIYHTLNISENINRILRKVFLFGTPLDIRFFCSYGELLWPVC